LFQKFENLQLQTYSLRRTGQRSSKDGCAFVKIWERMSGLFLAAAPCSAHAFYWRHAHAAGDSPWTTVYYFIFVVVDFLFDYLYYLKF
jgi:hypothetical protein